MALSAVVIVAPAAQASDFLSPRQDCSRTVVEADEGSYGILGLDRILVTAANLLYPSKGKGNNNNNDNDEVRAKNRGDHILGDRVDVDVRDSFNCSNIFHDSFTVDEDDRFFHNEHRDRDHGDRDHGDRDHGDRNHRDNNDRDHRGYGRTAPTAATAATAATAPTARTARVAR